jgi:intracellular multiplication protein IcmP
MSNGKGDDSSTALLFLVLFLIAGYWVFWWLFGNQFMDLVRWLRIGELTIINFFTGSYDEALAFMHGTKGATKQVGSVMLFTPEIADRVNLIITQYIKWPAVIILGGIGVYAAFFHKRTGFKHVFNLETLIQYQAKVWPVLTPIVKFNPAKHSARSNRDAVPIELPLFAEALSPEEWIAFNRINVVNGIPEREATRRALIQQLGLRWNGFGNLPFHCQALIAAFALKGVQKRDESDALLGEISLCWSQDKGFVSNAALRSKVNNILNDAAVGGKAAEVAQLHAYRTTAMLGVLKWARQSGVLAPAQFLWLRGEDRALWYPLNNLGRRAFHSEGAGALAHFMAEAQAQKPLPIPRVDTAIVTLNQYLANTQAKIPALAENGKAAKVKKV